MKTHSTGTPQSTTNAICTSTRNMKITINRRLKLSRTMLIRPFDSISDTELT
jgi:hypothetical protein